MSEGITHPYPYPQTAGLAQGLRGRMTETYGNDANAVRPRDPTLLDAMLTTLQQLREDCGLTLSRATSALDRATGSQPASGQINGNGAPKPPTISQMQQIGDVMEDLQQIAHAMRGNIERLERIV